MYPAPTTLAAVVVPYLIQDHDMLSLPAPELMPAPL